MQNCARSFQKIRLKEKNTPDPCIRSDMNILHSKIPCLPDAWTWARGIRYMAKLSAFILVPGLHQIVCNRIIFGGLLFCLFFIPNFYIHFQPYNFANFDYDWRFKADELVVIAKYTTWFLLVMDIKKQEYRTLRPVCYFLIVCFIAIPVLSKFHPHRTFFLFVETQSDVCPTYCTNDIVEFERRRPKNKTMPVGSHVILLNKQREWHVARILVASPETACKEEGLVSRYLPANNSFCRKMEPEANSRDYLNDYLVRGDDWPVKDAVGDKRISLISHANILGMNPRIIGNLLQYPVLNETTTRAIGMALLTIYEWTGLNFFRPDKQKPQYRRE
jgi:hypothetical protein